MTKTQEACLSRDDVKAVKFAIRRQLRRWRDHDLEPGRRQQRDRLVRVLDLLEQFPDGCELRQLEAAGDEGAVDEG
jgi:hypothetical protein